MKFLALFGGSNFGGSGAGTMKVKSNRARFAVLFLMADLCECHIPSGIRLRYFQRAHLYACIINTSGAKK